MKSQAPVFRYFDLVMAGFITVLLCANLLGPAKTCLITLPLVGAPLVFGAGNLFFPISYIFGDVLTEVYGYARARKVIWAGFGAMIFASVMAWLVINLPVNPAEPYNRTLQPALEVVFGSTIRIVAASILAFWVGDFVNSYVLAKMKVLTAGRYLWTRTIGSTVVGQGVDSLIFYPIAFYGIWDTATLWKVVAFNWLFKISIEILMTPITYLVVGFLKRREHCDYFDRETDFSPFSLADR